LLHLESGISREGNRLAGRIQHGINRQA